MFGQKLIQQVSSIKRKGISESLFFWGLIVIVVSLISFNAIEQANISITLFYLGVSMIVIGLIIFIIFCFVNPDYNRSEKFHLQSKSFEMLGHKGFELKIDKTLKLTSVAPDAPEEFEDKNQKIADEV